ncbi:MAG: DUF4215 domain-containing protein [Deltaproteobacteria bacterium]|nr:DUF4215 domain-containing protein [Deltaproteobacteria bacterium]
MSRAACSFGPQPRFAAGSLGAGALATLLAAACTALWGVDELRYEPRPQPSGSSSASGGGTGGEAGLAAGGAGAGGEGGLAAGGGGTGGAAPGGADAGPQCGNGFIEGDEECDDGNAEAGDGCQLCQVECGGANEIEHPSTHHCYRLTEQSGNWGAGKTACATWGGHLMTVGSAGEQSPVKPLVGGDTFLGASDSGHEGQFTWVTGEPWDYTNWAGGEPNGGTKENCLEIHSNLTWNDVECSTTNHALCERPPAGKLP